ncbi:NAD(P)-dependent glycerol-3-phosphate dehydrogenase [Hyphococcus flavus]|uniref:Glycerol-3-phosphate dehydrogenase [NAD(P)+] n=1 Tax=Hyphococcus flavus TaxID=1866326 RepID=A0AAE9ZDF3_9PROT|nr:NAD(P)H-dependent glycerol-3-phosphate dehydrogenase [Hyphococcus flavus]WDI32934.1 NAD(P)-dependent glycerol-3-phosphate dehydrogenase [Hyphococcus flavus]
MNSGRPFSSVGVIGGGAWGTALAAVCANNGVATTLWARESAVINSVNNHHENTEYLPGVPLPKTLNAADSLGMAGEKEALLFVVPAQFARSVFADLRAACPTAGMPVALCSKGIERSSGLLMTEVLSGVWPEAKPAVLSGPSFARDVAMGLPTAVTLACANKDLGARWMATIGAAHFRPYLSNDLTGAELGGAIKNVLAIAAGVVDGRGLGQSARAALIARGFAEFQRLGVALGAKKETMAGLSGLGDLILTASSSQSRNMSLGMELGKGRSLEEVLGERNTVSEGVATADAIHALAEKAGVEAPICEAVSNLVNGRKTVDEIIAALLARPFKSEA